MGTLKRVSKPKNNPVRWPEIDHKHTREDDANEVVEDVAPGVKRVKRADGKWACVVDPKRVAPAEK